VSGERHNVIHANGDATYAKHFGGLVAVTPVTLGSHRQSIAYVFRHGVHFDLTPEDAAEMVARTPAALAALPIFPDCSGAVVDLEAL
jgi:hypothetical protein